MPRIAQAAVAQKPQEAEVRNQQSEVAVRPPRGSSTVTPSGDGRQPPDHLTGCRRQEAGSSKQQAGSMKQQARQESSLFRIGRISPHRKDITFSLGRRHLQAKHKSGNRDKDVSIVNRARK